MFNPFTNLMKWAHAAQQSAQPSTLASAGAHAGIDLVVRDKILSKAHWSVRLIVPFILKQFSNLILDSSNGSSKKMDDQRES
jgi:hypothetical protein